MATYCLLAFWLVEGSIGIAPHCFEANFAVSSKFQSVTRSFLGVETLFRASNSSYTLKRQEKCTMSNFKLQEITLVLVVNGVLFLHIYEGVQTSRKYGNLTSTSLENNITAALTGSENTET